MGFLDDKSKKTSWWNKNYFYIGTIFIILINILLYWLFGNSWENDLVFIDGSRHWSDSLYFNPTILSFLNCFSHSNWQHVLLNMLTFAVSGSYLERKFGTFGIVGFVIFGAYISSIAVTCNNLSAFWHGFSGINYFIYAYIIVDYFFSLRKSQRNKAGTIFGVIIIALIYLAMCFNGGTTGFGFEIYPYDLISNMGHYTSFLVGLIISIFKGITELKIERQIKTS